MVWGSHLEVDTLLNAMQLGVVVHEADTSIVDANARALELLGISLRQAIGIDAFDPGWHFVDENGDPLATDEYPVSRVIATGAAVSNQKLGILAAPGARATWVSCNAYRRNDDNRIVVTFVDVTSEVEASASLRSALDETRVSKQQLAETAFRLEIALSAINAHTFDLDLTTGRLCLDASFEALLGYERDELAHYDLEQLRSITHPDDLLTRNESLAAIISGESETYFNSARLRHRSGQWLWVETRAKVLKRNEKGDVTHLVGLLFDITERRETEANLLQHQKMEALGTLAGGIAHDFNNLLVPMLGYAELARRSLPDECREQEYVGNICTAANRAKDLVQKILLVSRTSTAEKQPVSLVALVREVLVVLNASIPKGIRLQTRWQEPLPTIFADPSEIYQVVLNLCTNAVQAMSGEGELTLGIEHTQQAPTSATESSRPAGYVVVTIEDTGCGMDETTVEQIFDPFFTTKLKGEQRGTGLGLSIVASVVREHEGSVAVDSEPGIGTRFTIHLPAAEAAELASEVQPESVAKVPNARVMFVDDEEMVRELGVEMLELLDYRVKAFENGQQALDCFSANPDDWDLILTDYEMPGLSGPKLVEHIRAIRQDIPVILLTGYTHLTAEEERTRYQVNAVLAKPYDPDALDATIRQALASVTR